MNSHMRKTRYFLYKNILWLIELKIDSRKKIINTKKWYIVYDITHMIINRSHDDRISQSF